MPFPFIGRDFNDPVPKLLPSPAIRRNEKISCVPSILLEWAANMIVYEGWSSYEAMLILLTASLINHIRRGKGNRVTHKVLVHRLRSTYSQDIQKNEDGRCLEEEWTSREAHRVMTLVEL
jgi:hypothetical protein